MTNLLETYQKKILRVFEPPLSATDLAERLRMSHDVADYVITHQDYVGWIKSIWVFGSLARNNSKASSDIDLAVLVKRVVEFGDEYIAIHERMYLVIEQGKYILGIPPQLQIIPTILQSSWLIDPEWTTDNPGVIYRIKNEGRQLISRE